MAGDQDAVEIEHQTAHHNPAAAHRRDRPARLAAQQPGPFPRHCPSPCQLAQNADVDRVEHTPAVAVEATGPNSPG